jgi:hypothetical protein
MDAHEIAAPLKGVSENLAAKKAPPLKEVWWGSLNALGKNAAFCEALHLDPERIPEVAHDIEKMCTSLPFPEALGVAFMRWAGVTVHLGKKPLSAQAGATEGAR